MITCSGTLFLSKSTERFLFLLRSQGKTAETWGITGGKKEPSDSTPYETLMREIIEEIGFMPEIEKTIPIEQYTSKDNMFFYNTYVSIVKEEFIPSLNDEHYGYAWVSFEKWPKPLHLGVKTTLTDRIIKTKLDTILKVI